MVSTTNTYVCIGGLHRSGTSLLHRLLRAHDEISGFSDTGVPEDEGQHLQDVYPAAKHFGGPGAFAFNAQAYLDEHNPLVTQRGRANLQSAWNKHHDLNKPILLEKSPPNLIRSRFLQAMLPQAKFIFIVRHPVAVSLATHKWRPVSLSELLLHWYSAHQILLNDLKHLTDFRIVRYEDLLANPELVLRDLFEFMQLAYLPPSETIENHNDSYLTTWHEQHLSQQVILPELFPQVVEFMHQFGYHLQAPYVQTDKLATFIQDH